MSQNLGNFLVDLACNPDLLTLFKDDPQAALARASLTLDEQAAILTRDSRLLASALGASPGKSGQGITIKHKPKPKKGGKPAPKKGPRKPSGSKKR